MWAWTERRINQMGDLSAGVGYIHRAGPLLERFAQMDMRKQCKSVCAVCQTCTFFLYN
eukprot:NODE_3433_length_555_cov_89.749012_g2899_i0.p6 GENE.NODE_3433_length_555_cov_89.749012_g2899_i0~~NODE_3433_length_555_cov_89.749012_g2899_i0.p6  ORF type:complete len:58 (+),score=3.33 NODE_3433_length_555_cov_89.749012_g2899_i0:67-240(+)